MSRTDEILASLLYPCPDHGDCAVTRVLLSSADRRHRSVFYVCGRTRLVLGDLVTSAVLRPDPPTRDEGPGLTIEQILGDTDTLLAEVSAMLHLEEEASTPESSATLSAD